MTCLLISLWNKVWRMELSLLRYFSAWCKPLPRVSLTCGSFVGAHCLVLAIIYYKVNGEPFFMSGWNSCSQGITLSLHLNLCFYDVVVYCSDRILTFGIRSIRSPAKVGLVVIKLLTTSPVGNWRGWGNKQPPPPSPQHHGSTVILCSTTVE